MWDNLYIYLKFLNDIHFWNETLTIYRLCASSACKSICETDR